MWNATITITCVCLNLWIGSSEGLCPRTVLVKHDHERDCTRCEPACHRHAVAELARMFAEPATAMISLDFASFATSKLEVNSKCPSRTYKIWKAVSRFCTLVLLNPWIGSSQGRVNFRMFSVPKPVLQMNDHEEFKSCQTLRCLS